MAPPPSIHHVIAISLIEVEKIQDFQHLNTASLCYAFHFPLTSKLGIVAFLGSERLQDSGNLFGHLKPPQPATCRRMPQISPAAKRFQLSCELVDSELL